MLTLSLGIAGAAAIIAKSLLANTAYTVTRVIDGDTFETREKQIIRIADIDAPENKLCWSDKSKQALENLILNQKVYLKVTYLDRFRRQIADVYLANGKSVKDEMTRSGNVTVRQMGKSDPNLLKLEAYARDKKIGVFSGVCTQDVNPKNKNCDIKGNIGTEDNNKVYHYPGCPLYNVTKLELYKGDQWFCSQNEAIKSGFRKADMCP
jgi:micrococcal nuclease